MDFEGARVEITFENTRLRLLRSSSKSDLVNNPFFFAAIGVTSVGTIMSIDYGNFIWEKKNSRRRNFKFRFRKSMRINRVIGRNQSERVKLKTVILIYVNYYLT